MNQASTQPNWIERNWKWLLALVLAFGFACVLAFVALIFYSVTSMLKSPEPYAHAMELTRKHPTVMQSIGAPIEEAWLMSGNMSTSGGSGEASFAIPISGPKGEATVYVEAKRRVGKWEYEDLIVELEASKQRIDLRPDSLE
jgi:hypothetical protein